MKFNRYNTVIWDWNGTLLNDVDMCIKCMNQLLRSRNIPLLTKKRYQEVFTFPVQDYYEKIGINFSKDPFNIIGHDFMDLYFEELPDCELHVDAIPALMHFQRQGKRQYILSAMEHQALVKAMKDYKIGHFFEAVYGIDNHLAAGKIDRGIQMMREYQISTKETIMFGDTLHDKEVADKLNLDIVLIANGHQDFNRLKKSKMEVYTDLNSILV
ncbi:MULTISPECIES: HAD family hydrolase [unclassified Lentimicrobium]|uniref:HAD family hydrolase n=1 Tax=unclassified Lentimicrobium TaxID=2677434 RepID=UPI0015544896|nr:MULTISPECIES: HAD hydrolase-like protein [unclassified Lentimicrobium]NPD45697.1 HAD family hydrolase [Lentimicrobium sp. S6]NPD85576.1 HAD family hydrolase [Lentimicrobium sp. L6]